MLEVIQPLDSSLILSFWWLCRFRLRFCDTRHPLLLNVACSLSRRSVRGGGAFSHLSGASERPMEYLGGGVSGFKWGFSTVQLVDDSPGRWLGSYNVLCSRLAGELYVLELYIFAFWPEKLYRWTMQSYFRRRLRGPKRVLQYTGPNFIPWPRPRPEAAWRRYSRNFGSRNVYAGWKMYGKRLHESCARARGWMPQDANFPQQ